MNVTPTVEIIKAISDEFAHTSNVLNNIARNMVARNDMSYAAEAINAVRNTYSSIRLDLLVTRPIREMQEEIDRAKREAK